MRVKRACSRRKTLTSPAATYSKALRRLSVSSIPHPSFESQTKVKLINPEVQGAVSQVVTEAFNEFLELNPREARTHCR